MLLMMFSNAKGLRAGLRRHFSHALVDLEVCGARYPMVSPCFPMCCNWLRHLETIETQSEIPVFFSAPLFRSVWWLMGGGILSTTTPWRVWR